MRFLVYLKHLASVHIHLDLVAVGSLYLLLFGGCSVVVQWLFGGCSVVAVVFAVVFTVAVRSLCLLLFGGLWVLDLFFEFFSFSNLFFSNVFFSNLFCSHSSVVD